MVDLHGDTLSLISTWNNTFDKTPSIIQKICLHGEIKINRCIIILGDLYIRLIGEEFDRMEKALKIKQIVVVLIAIAAVAIGYYMFQSITSPAKSCCKTRKCSAACK